MTDFTNRKFTASDVKSAAGLSYRQLNEWDHKGALPLSREDDASWRKFSPKAMFVILVCQELRKRFNIPLDSLRWLQTFMMQDGADHFAAALRLMSHGLNVLVLTDFKRTFEMAADVDIADMLDLGYTRHEEEEAFVLLKVNPLINKMLACLKQPVELKISGEIYRVIYDSRKGLTLRSRDEFDVIELLRDGTWSKVVIQLSDGQIVRTDAESEHGRLSSEELVKLIEEADFQTVTVSRQNGKTVRVARTKPNVMRRKRARQEPPERRVAASK